MQKLHHDVRALLCSFGYVSGCQYPAQSKLQALNVLFGLWMEIASER